VVAYKGSVPCGGMEASKGIKVLWQRIPHHVCIGMWENTIMNNSETIPVCGDSKYVRVHVKKHDMHKHLTNLHISVTCLLPLYDAKS